MTALARLLLAAATLLALAFPAVAIDTGTPAWLIKGQALFEGPGNAYRVTGELGDETRIRVDRCSERWCRIHAEGQRGWVSLSNVSFGQEPRGPLTGPRPNYPTGATVCLYSGRNYGGSEACVPARTVVRDLLLFGVDNSIRSVRVNGGSVTLCRDRNFSSYCERIIEDKPRLSGFLDGNVSSYRVW